MLNLLSLNKTLDALVPITRFNKGEANKIFEEVHEAGCKIVVKNNSPTCILITPEKYQELVDMIEDQCLLALAQEREERDTGITYPAAEVYKELGITEEKPHEPPIEYGVDFE